LQAQSSLDGYGGGGGRCVQELFAEVALRTPDALALVHEGAQVTYGELDRRAEALARILAGLGVGPEVLVAVVIARSIEMVVAALAILKAGGAYVPIDPEQPVDRLAYLLDDSGAAVVLTQTSLAGQIPRRVDREVLAIDGVLPSPRPASGPARRPSVDQLAYVIYTSGSTGQPKGVAVRHAGLLNLVAWHQRAFAVTRADRATQLAGPGFDAVVWEIWPYLTIGASISLASEEVRLSPERLQAWLLEREITVAFAPTPLAERLLALPWTEPVPLRILLTGGDKLHLRPRSALPFTLVNNYGPTEYTVVTTSGPVAPEAADQPPAPDIGHPIANTRVQVLDPTLERVPVGVEGELHIGGAGLSRGYLGRPDLTAERFVPDPFAASPGARLYRTGDLVRQLSDGAIEFVGRADFQVKIRGFRIELGEIESALLGHPGVQEAVALVVGEADHKRLVAYVVASATQLPTMDGLRGHARSKLPEYMVPQVFVRLERLPLTPNGKIDRKGLPAPEVTGDEHHVDARSAVEAQLIEIWRELLDAKRIGVFDQFFDLGGDSLVAHRVLSRINRELRVELSVVAFLAAGTVAKLAEAVAAARRVARVEIPVAPRTEPLPLSFQQRWMWEAQRRDPARYNEAVAFVLDGDLDLEALRRSLDVLVRRHEALRATVRAGAGEPTLQIGSAPDDPLAAVDLTAIDEAERMPRAVQLAVEDARRPLDLDQGPLFRFTILGLSAQRHVLLLTVHHLVSDGWSREVFLEELDRLYRSRGDEAAAALPPLRIQFADFAAWQRRRLSGAALEEHLAFWRRQLDDRPRLARLPRDLEGPLVPPPGGSFPAGRYLWPLPSEYSRRLVELGKRVGCTPFVAVIAAFEILLHLATGSEDVAVGVLSGVRDDLDTENVIGLFVCELLVRTRVDGEASFIGVIQRVSERLAEAHAHRDLPVVEALPAAARAAPAFQVLFNQHHIPRFALGDLSVNALPLPLEGRARTDLRVIHLQGEAHSVLSIQYRSDCFQRSTIEALVARYERLLGQLLDRPDQPAGTFARADG
jgi:amino acid adenylation domain-containing protein